MQTKPDLNIRFATCEDANLLTDLMTQTFYEAFAADNTSENMAAYAEATFGPERQEAELRDENARFLIAERDGSLIGYAKLLVGEVPDCVVGINPIELVRFYVVKECYGQGVSHALMQACVDTARQAGHGVLWLGVWEHNLRAQAFYRKWRFEQVGDHIFQMGDDPQTDFIVMRPL